MKARRIFHYAGLGLLLALTAIPAALPAETPLLDLASHRGKVVVVDFWASRCVPCRRSIPWLNAMREKYADEGLDVIGINVGADLAAATRFLGETPAHFHVVYNPEGHAEGKKFLGGKTPTVAYRYMTDDWQLDSHTLEGRFRWPLSCRILHSGACGSRCCRCRGVARRRQVQPLPIRQHHSRDQYQWRSGRYGWIQRQGVT